MTHLQIYFMRHLHNPTHPPSPPILAKCFRSQGRLCSIPLVPCSSISLLPIKPSFDYGLDAYKTDLKIYPVSSTSSLWAPILPSFLSFHLATNSPENPYTVIQGFIGPLLYILSLITLRRPWWEPADIFSLLSFPSFLLYFTIPPSLSCNLCINSFLPSLSLLPAAQGPYLHLITCNGGIQYRWA